MANYTDLVLSFALYSFLGWLLEVAYSGIWEGKLTNRGFLFGPISPIYGAGAIMILFTANIVYSFAFHDSLTSLTIILLVSTVLVTVLEYMAALFLEKFLGIKLWDYSSEAFNLQGRVSLKYSLFWGVLAWILVIFIHPWVNYYFLQIPSGTKSVVSFLFIIYLFVDAFFSIRRHLLNSQA